MSCEVRNYFSKGHKVEFALLIDEKEFLVLLDALSGKQNKATAMLYQKLGKLI